MNGENDTMYYVHKDYLGSYDVITDESGNVLERLSFDPWGRRRNATDWTFDNLTPNHLFDRGYTGHEHLDVFSLINMNGRVYDPWLGRFLSPDPFVQSPDYSQSYNRYSYCLNNPLKYSDPSGYCAWKFEPSDYLATFGGGYGAGIFRINWNQNLSALGSYSYDWNTGTYRNSKGEEVTWDEVFVNYVQPNSTCIYNSYSNSFSNNRNHYKSQGNRQKPVNKNNFLADFKKTLLDPGGMMFNGTWEDVLDENLNFDLTLTPWMDFALAELDKNVEEIKGDDANDPRIIEYLKAAGLSGEYLKDETAWCASFVYWCLDQAGIDGAGARGNDWKSWGQALEGPRYGAIAVFTWSHVGFVIGMDGSNIVILHGNWSGKLTTTIINPSSISIYRYPTEYLPSPINP